jgi:hypothetical protein
MNWKMLGKTFRFGTIEVEFCFDHIDASRGYFCGTHNFLEFYVVGIYANSDQPEVENLNHYGAFSGCYTGEVILVPAPVDPREIYWDMFGDSYQNREVHVAFFRGKIQHYYNTNPPYGNPFDLIRHNLDHKCECPDFIKHWNTPSGDHQGHVLASRMRDEAFPETMETVLDCPAACVASGYTLWSLIQHLNDSHKWSRERIADWLETLDVDLAFPVPSEVPKEPGEQ